MIVWVLQVGVLWCIYGAFMGIGVGSLGLCESDFVCHGGGSCDCVFFVGVRL